MVRIGSTRPLLAFLLLFTVSQLENCLVESFAPTSRRAARVVASTRSSPSYYFHPTQLFIFSNDDEELEDISSAASTPSPAIVLKTSRVLRRTEWLSWWAQVILTTVSAVTLLFARSVIGKSADTSTIIGGFFFAGAGILSSCLSILWTWGGARLARRWRRRQTKEITAASMLRRAIKLGSMLNLVGMGLTLLGAGQIVGGLAIKVLTMSQGTVLALGNVAGGGGLQTLQPLDILIVQANVNLLLSHYLSLVGLLYLVRYLDKLDPPSVPEKEKNNKK